MLALRQRVENDTMLRYQQDRYQTLKTIYGIENAEPCIQSMRTIVAKVTIGLIDPSVIDTDNVECQGESIIDVS
jgi:hypothetical protein